jgi:hypothetical protein
MVLFHHFFNWAVGDSALFERFPEHCYMSYPNAVEFFLLFAPVCLTLVCMDWVSFRSALLLEIPMLILVDFLCDVFDMGAFIHRCTLVQSKDGKLNEKYSTAYCVVAHFLANMYVHVLESGRVYGHISRKEMSTNFARRFDWHCGRLPRAKENFVRMEFCKFMLFLLVSVLNMGVVLHYDKI